jgi:hypothetical protein
MLLRPASIERTWQERENRKWQSYLSALFLTDVGLKIQTGTGGQELRDDVPAETIQALLDIARHVRFTAMFFQDIQ